MGRLYDLLQEHMDSQHYRVSKRQLAQRLEVSPSTIDNWRNPEKLIAKKHLMKIAAVTGNPYSRVLDALLDDIGYLNPDARPTRSPEEVAKDDSPAPK